MIIDEGHKGCHCSIKTKRYCRFAYLFSTKYTNRRYYNSLYLPFPPAMIINMLQPIKHILDTQRIVLASTSPRRKEIMDNLGIKFEICASLFDEKNLDPSNYDSPSSFVMDTAFHKVDEVATRLGNDTNPPDLIIGADTVVSLEGKVFGKPENEDIAFKMLKQLSGRAHEVYTGVILVHGRTTVKFFDTTKVFFSPMSDETIKKYIETGEPLDKAGGYGIQGPGGSLIEKINGDFYTVMGLPLHKLCKHVLELYRASSLE